MKPIAIFYHCLFFQGVPDHPAPRGGEVIQYQMGILKDSGLLDACERLVVGINGGEESKLYADCYLPEQGQRVFHGVDSSSENPTLYELEKFAKANPGHNLLYFHAKGACHTDVEYIKFLKRWVRCMMNACVLNWRTCVKDLDSCDSVGCHWMMNVGVPPVDNIWGGNFWWATANFINRIPSILERPAVKQFGLKSEKCRYEAERWIGNGGVMPTVKDYHLNGIGSCP